MDQEVKDFVFQSVNNAPIETHPYPFLYVNNVFPAEFYAKMISMMPDESLYKEGSTARTSNAYSLKSRKRINLNSEDILSIKDEKQAFWTELRDFLASDEFTLLFIEKFRSELTKRYKQLNTTTRIELLKDTTDYRISPHTDAPHKILTLLFYLPSSYAQTHLGTSIYVPKEEGYRNERGIQLDFEDFETYRRVSYLPNTLFCFMKTDNSFHGRDPIVDQEVRRDLLNCSIQHVQA